MEIHQHVENKTKALSKNIKASLLIEIGVEELPASFLAPAAENLKNRFSEFFKQNRIAYKGGRDFYTPRRICVLFKEVAAQQYSEEIEIQGPPKKLSFDAEGKPTQMALGFVHAHNVRIDDVYIRKTDKGEYLFIKKRAPCELLRDLIRKHIAKIIFGLDFPKIMRWSSNRQLRFARPVRWICIVYGSQALPASFDGLKSSNTSRGHRNIKNKKVIIDHADHYCRILKKNYVLVDQIRRKEFIRRELQKIAKKINGLIVTDEDLLEETNNTCEMPKLILCRFDPKYLSLPQIVLITTFKQHLRAFTVKSSTSVDLLPYFIVTTNNPACDGKYVGRWYEEAARARLEDAKFYFEEDLKVKLESRIEDEKQVVWLENLGSLFDKTLRLEKLTLVMGQIISGVDIKSLLRAAYLSKADLLTNMIREKEYATLKGVIGGIYARIQGENDLVSKIIMEHYLPQTSEDQLPTTCEGAILSIADKIDNIVGVFMINEIPTGSIDKFGVRRQANAIYSICLAQKLPIDLEQIIELNVSYFKPETDKNLIEQIKNFLRERLRIFFSEHNFEYDIINAVLALPGINPYDFYLRCQAIKAFRNTEDFKALVIEQKRVNNILNEDYESTSIRQELFKESEEVQLYNSAKAIEPILEQLISKRAYFESLKTLSQLKLEIDKFFDKVLVMTDDTVLRNNRIALLTYIRSLFYKIADFSKIVLS
jgi:glycyl-tRNA synthetase beta chain